MSNLPVFRIPMTSKPSTPSTVPTFESCLSTFTVNTLASPISPPPVDDDPTVAAPLLGIIIDPATCERLGSITHDRQQRRPTHEWSSLQEFHAWRTSEERDHGIELLLSGTRRSDGPLWHENRVYSCSRQGTGGERKYVRKHKYRTTRASKRTGCRCKVIVKTYHHVSTVVGWYRTEHDHATGVANFMFTRLPDSTRAHALNLLRSQMSAKEVLTRVRRAHSKHERGHYITIGDIYFLRRVVKREEEAARSISSDQPNSEHSEGSPTGEDEDEETTMQPEDASVTDLTQVDDDLDVSDEQSDGCTDPGIPTSPPSGSTISHVYTAGAAASMESALLPVVSATQVAHNTAPLIPPPHSMPVSYYMPTPPLVVYIPYPPYQMTLYPVYPAYFPPPTC